MKFLITTLLLSFQLYSFGQIDSNNIKLTYKTDQYSIKFPKSWDLDTSKLKGTEFFLLSSRKNNKDTFIENINLMIQDYTGQNINCFKYKTMTDKQLAAAVKKEDVFESVLLNSTTKGEYYRVTYAIKQDKYKVKITSICYTYKSKVYLLTFSAEADKYELYKKVGMEILNSFTLVK